MPIRIIIYTIIFGTLMLLIALQVHPDGDPLIEHYVALKWAAGMCLTMMAYNLVTALFRFIDYATEED